MVLSKVFPKGRQELYDLCRVLEVKLLKSKIIYITMGDGKRLACLNLKYLYIMCYKNKYININDIE